MAARRSLRSDPVGRTGGWDERRWRAARRRIRETLALRRADAAAGQRNREPAEHPDRSDVSAPIGEVV